MINIYDFFFNKKVCKKYIQILFWVCVCVYMCMYVCVLTVYM